MTGMTQGKRRLGNFMTHAMCNPKEKWHDNRTSWMPHLLIYVMTGKPLFIYKLFSNFITSAMPSEIPLVRISSSRFSGLLGYPP